MNAQTAQQMNAEHRRHDPQRQLSGALIGKLAAGAALLMVTAGAAIGNRSGGSNRVPSESPTYLRTLPPIPEEIPKGQGAQAAVLKADPSVGPKTEAALVAVVNGEAPTGAEDPIFQPGAKGEVYVPEVPGQVPTEVGPGPIPAHPYAQQNFK